MVAAEEICSYLPEELLECTFKYLHGDNRSFMSLSLVSKQFLYITNRIRFLVTITDETIPFLPRLFHRFPNLTSLNLAIVPKIVEEVNALLTLISTFPLDIKSIRLCPKRILRPIQIPANGLIALSKTKKNMTSLSFYQMGHFDKKNLLLIADCFPLLQELNLCNPWLTSDTDFMVDHKDPLLALPNLRKINLSGNYIGDSDQFANFLRHNCTLLQEITLSLGNLGNMTVLVL
ncbi:unnamed protein product [Lathyrus oleraceus]|uniref:uncharacterized protein LOC127131154 n=1 Tax=Pisum sativum TaxID=3888 RepID=UPI0021CF8C2F|nr:uncharacterized protein LOC127131154 [Pisum sativum]